jgi:hypothetical protein
LRVVEICEAFYGVLKKEHTYVALVSVNGGT